MPRAPYEPFNVYLNCRLVGQLRRAISGAISLQYDCDARYVIFGGKRPRCV